VLNSLRFASSALRFVARWGAAVFGFLIFAASRSGLSVPLAATGSDLF
jgi:hypothetical protein